MNKADDLQSLFQDFRPELNSNQVFMEQLNRKLDAVEYIKQLQERQIRRYQCAVWVAFFAGGVCCAVLLAFLYILPEQISLWNFDSEMNSLVFLEQNGRMLASVFLSLLMSFCIIHGVNLMYYKKDVTSQSFSN